MEGSQLFRVMVNRDRGYAQGVVRLIHLARKIEIGLVYFRFDQNIINFFMEV